MTDPNRTAIMMILDKSGSMEEIKEATQSAIDGYVAAAKDLPGQVTIRIVQFSSVYFGQTSWYEEVSPSLPPEKVPAYTLNPGGGTALLDAIGRGVTEFGEELAVIPEEQRPGHVILVIATDGEENSSHEYSREAVKKILTRQQDEYQWDVVYLAAGQDAIKEGAKMGIRADSAITYDANEAAVGAVVASAATYTSTSVRTGLAAFTDDDRRKASKTRS